MFEVVGGQPFFDALVERFYGAGRVAIRRCVAIYPDDLDAGHAGARAVPRPVLGRPARRTASEKGHPRLRMRHAPFADRPAERDAWLAAMLAALDEVGRARSRHGR